LNKLAEYDDLMPSWTFVEERHLAVAQSNSPKIVSVTVHPMGTRDSHHSLFVVVLEQSEEMAPSKL